MSKGALQAVAQRAIEGREAAGAPRTQGKAESAGAEHRAAEGEHGAKMPDDYCELWAQGRAASALCAHRRPEGLEWRAHGAKRSAQPRNTAQASAQGGAKMRNDHAELWNRSPFAFQSSPAACTAGAHEARALCAKQREVSPMSQGTLQAARRSRVTIANCG